MGNSISGGTQLFCLKVFQKLFFNMLFVLLLFLNMLCIFFSSFFYAFFFILQHFWDRLLFSIFSGLRLFSEISSLELILLCWGSSSLCSLLQLLYPGSSLIIFFPSSIFIYFDLWIRLLFHSFIGSSSFLKYSLGSPSSIFSVFVLFIQSSLRFGLSLLQFVLFSSIFSVFSFIQYCLTGNCLLFFNLLWVWLLNKISPSFL